MLTESLLRVVITPVAERPGREGAELNSRRGHEIVHRLQNITAPSVFNPRAFFDGKKNLFSVGPLKMQGDAAEVRRPCIHFPSRRSPGEARVRVCSRVLACYFFFTVLGQYDGPATTSRAHSRPIQRQADKSERLVSMASFLLFFLRVCRCAVMRWTNRR